MKRDPGPVAVYLTIEGQPEERVAVFYNERFGYTALESARRYAKWRQPGGWNAKGIGWHWRFERVQAQEEKV